MKRRRDGAHELFEGRGTGMDHKAAKGTFWGAYNAVVETEDYRQGRDAVQSSQSAMFGDRMKHKRRAFNASMEACKA